MSRVGKEEAIETTINDYESGLFKLDALLSILYEFARIDAAQQIGADEDPQAKAFSIEIGALMKANLAGMDSHVMPVD